jgi:hypothetical protein
MKRAPAIDENAKAKEADGRGSARGRSGEEDDVQLRIEHLLAILAVRLFLTSRRGDADATPTR